MIIDFLIGMIGGIAGVVVLIVGMVCMREKEIEQKLKRETEKRGGMCLKFLSSVSGVPDRIVLLPEGKIAFIELKAPGKKPRPLQVRQMRKLRELGVGVYVVDGIGMIGRVLEEIENG